MTGKKSIFEKRIKNIKTSPNDLTKTKGEIIVLFKNLTKKFGSFYAVSNINLEIKRGEIVGFLGANGAGKSTTMKMMANLLRPTSGEIWIRGNGELQRLTNKNKDSLLDNMGFLIENPAFYGDVSPRTILSYFGKLKGYPRKNLKKRVEEVVSMFGLSEWIDKKIKTFSKGMRQKIGVLSAIVHDPDIVILDEPQTGLDPRARREVRDFIIKLKQSGKTIFLSSHLLYEISEIADRVAIINKGKLIAFDTLENLEQKARKSVINFELLNIDNKNFKQVLEDLNRIILPLTGMNGNTKVISKEGSKIFEVSFNGTPENQLKIHNALFENNYSVLEFSVPKTNLLESLFIGLTESFYEENQSIKNNINVN